MLNCSGCINGVEGRRTLCVVTRTHGQFAPVSIACVLKFIYSKICFQKLRDSPTKSLHAGEHSARSVHIISQHPHPNACRKSHRAIDPGQLVICLDNPITRQAEFLPSTIPLQQMHASVTQWWMHSTLRCARGRLVVVKLEDEGLSASAVRSDVTRGGRVGGEQLHERCSDERWMCCRYCVMALGGHLDGMSQRT